LRHKNSIVTEEFIFAPQGEHSHGSSIVALPNGDFLAVWFQGSGKRTADDVRIMGARLEKGKKDWSKPFVAADTPNKQSGGSYSYPCLIQTADGLLHITYSSRTLETEKSIKHVVVDSDIIK